MFWSASRAAGYGFVTDGMSLREFFFERFDFTLPVIISAISYTHLSVIRAGSLGALESAAASG